MVEATGWVGSTTEFDSLTYFGLVNRFIVYHFDRIIRGRESENEIM